MLRVTTYWFRPRPYSLEMERESSWPLAISTAETWGVKLLAITDSHRRGTGPFFWEEFVFLLLILFC